MAEPSPTHAPQVADVEPTPLANGTPSAPDVEMVDSAPAQEQPQPDLQQQPQDQDTLPQSDPQTSTTTTSSLQPTVQTAPPTPTPTQPPSAPSLPAAPASSRNSPHPAPQSAPDKPIPHGSPTRVYLNQYVTPHLLEAMKHLATLEPEKPLKWLSEYLAGVSEREEGRD